MANDTWTAPGDWTTNEVVTAAKLNQQLRDNLYALWLAITTGSTAITERFSSGVYTPTLTNGTNVAASGAYECQWMRIGSVVAVSGKADIDPTASATITSLGIELPVASNFAAGQDCGGVGASYNLGTAGAFGAIVADPDNDRALLNFYANSLANQGWFFTFQYQVI